MEHLRAQIRRHTVGVLRYKWIALLVAWIACVAGWIGVAAIPNRYEAYARVYINADAVLTPLLHGIALDDPLGAQIEILQRTLLARPKLEKLISKTDLSLQIRQPSDVELMVTKLASEIAVVPQTQNLFTITYRNSDPHLAYDVVRTILGIFVEDKTGSSRSDMANAKSFINDQIDAYETKLRDAERQRADFRTKYVDVLPTEGNGASRLDQARESVRRLEGQLADARDRRDRLVAEVNGTPPTIMTETGDAGGATTARADLLAAEAKLRELRTTLTDQHPDVLRQQKLVDSLRHNPPPPAQSTASANAQTRGRAVPNPVYDQLKVMLVQAESDLASLSRQVDDARAERARLEQIAHDAPTVQAEYVNINRDYDVLRKNYEELLARRESMRIASAADTQADKIKLDVVDPPQIPQVPVSPKRPLLLTGVMAAGVGAGIAAAFLLSQLDRSFHTTLDLRDLGLSIAGSISMLNTGARRGRGLRVLANAMATVAILLLGAAYAGVMYAAIHGLQGTGFT